jgi:hypothetical protein
MKKTYTAGWMHLDPKVAIFDGPPAEALARKLGVFDAMRDYARAQVKRTGTTQRAVGTYIRGEEIIGAVYWDGFADPKDNGLVCCVARLVLLRRSVEVSGRQIGRQIGL